jgi:hypothetical protein
MNNMAAIVMGLLIGLARVLFYGANAVTRQIVDLSYFSSLKNSITSSLNSCVFD